MTERSMYRWRSMSDEQRAAVLSARKADRRPWHNPPHFQSDTSAYLITAACFEHRPIVGTTPARLGDFEQAFLNLCSGCGAIIDAWTILPNHYHALVRVRNVKALLREIGRLHGRTSYAWNGEDDRRGRQVWFNAAETAMKSERHFWATLLYVFHNAVKHGYAEQWQDWPFCNARDYLDAVGRNVALEMWHQYPIDDYGNEWDPSDL